LEKLSAGHVVRFGNVTRLATPRTPFWLATFGVSLPRRVPQRFFGLASLLHRCLYLVPPAFVTPVTTAALYSLQLRFCL